MQEQQKVKQRLRSIQHSKQKLQDILANASEQYHQEETRLEEAIGSTLSESARKMSGAVIALLCWTVQI